MQPSAAAVVSARGAWVILGLLSAIAILNFVDRMLIASAIPLIKEEFKLTDTAIGALAATFALVYALGGIPLGRLADVIARRRVIAGTAALWSVMTALCGICPTYTALVAARMGVAFGEAGYMPAVYSMLSDLFSPAKRNFAFSIIISACSIGVIGGISLGGWLAVLYGWRMAFLYVGLIGLVLSLIAASFIREPQRGALDEGARADLTDYGLLRGVRRLSRDGVIVWSVATAGFTGYCHGIIHWMPSFFERVHHLPLETVGAVFGGTFGVGLTVGQLTSGYVATLMARRGTFEPLRICVITNAVMVPGFAIVLLAGSPAVALGLAFVTAFFGNMGGPVLTAAIQNSAPQRLRGIAHACLTISLATFGLGLGPLIVGVLSDFLTPRIGPAEALRCALLASIGMFAVATLTSWMAFRAGRRADLAILAIR